MQGTNKPQLRLGDEALYEQVSPQHFLLRVEEQVDWSMITPILGSLYGSTGRPSHPPLVLFKMLLLAQWFALSDPQCEAQCRDRLSFRRFLNLSLSDGIPDETVLVRFRQRLLGRGVMEQLFTRLTEQLQSKGLLIKQGTLIDASIVESARRAPPKDGGGGSADGEAGYAIKRDCVTHGYKAHIAVDQGSDMVRKVIATSGQVHDSQVLEQLLEGATARAIYADKAYDDRARREKLKRRGIAARILYKAKRNAPLSGMQKALNRRWSKVRANVERIFADWKERRTMARCRYLGLAKNQLHFSLLALAHNLRRMTVLCP